MGTLQIKRVYEPAEKGDGIRILVDRLWPRGMKKETAQLTQWMKAIAPSTDLRKWFDHDPAKWEQFCLKYTLELQQNSAVENLLKLIKENKMVTLLYAAHDGRYNHAIVLQQFINEVTK
ncbi:MAG: DUF488 domain-containing protein [Bacteroidota bacterium]